MKFLRAIRLDESDRQVFERVALPGEWAVPGSFAFWDADPAQLSGKARQAFAQGFLGTGSFGWTSLAMISEITAAEHEQVIRQLARRLLSHHGAPDERAARQAAEAEARFTQTLCEHSLDTLIAVSRIAAADGIEESFRVVSPPSAIDHSRVKLWG